MDKSTLNRIANTLQHISIRHHDSQLNTSSGLGGSGDGEHHPLQGEPNVKQLQKLLDGAFEDDRNKLRKLFQENDAFNEPHLTRSDTSKDHRERTIHAANLIIQQNIVSIKDMHERTEKFVSWFEALGYCDQSVALKFAVQYNLWGGTILFLGTEKHHKKYLDRISNGTLLGVFGLTELGHGSNVNGLETTATFCKEKKEFIINSPTWTSQKYWPGNIATHGEMATVFARLIIEGRDHGVHAFVVPIRTPPSHDHPYGEVLPGREIRDIGIKSSFNGIDNGGLLFKEVRIPLDNMLDRFSHVTADGRYESTIPPNRHFAAMMSVFYVGRLCISALAMMAAKEAVSIALHYSHNRKQFGEPGRGDEPIINHSSHQRRLIPWLARLYALDFAHKHIVANSKMMAPDVQHSYSSGIKAVNCWDSLTMSQQARECMGGQGMRLHSRVPVLRDHIDLGATGEGDNTVLCQQVAKFLLSKYHQHHQSSLATNKNFEGELLYINNLSIKPGSTNLRSMSYQQWLLEQREFILLSTLYNKMYGNNNNIKMNSVEWYRLWNQYLWLAIKLARANVDRLIHSIFLQKIVSVEKQVDNNTLLLLKRMCCLDGLVQIHNDIGLFSSSGLIPQGEKWIDIEQEITNICKELTPYSLQIAQSFAIPPKFHPYLNGSIE